MKVVVLGAPADQGIPLVAELRRRGCTVTAAVRRPGAMAETPFPDVPEVAAQLDDPASLAAAFAGHDALALHLPFEFDRARAARMGRNVAQAAAAAGLRKIIFNTSCYVADNDLGLSAHDGRRDIAAAIADSGVPYAIVEPMVFMDNIVRVWAKPAIVASGIFAYPAAPDLRIALICLEDVAAFMVAALLAEDVAAERIAIGGPEALVGAEVADRLTAATGRPVAFHSLAPDEFAARMSALVTGSRDVAPHSIYDGMARFYRWYNDQPASPLAIDSSAAAARLGVTQTSFAKWAARQDWTA